MSERLTTRLSSSGVGYDNGEYFKVCYPWKENCLSDIDRMAIRLCELEDKIEKGDVVEVVRCKDCKHCHHCYPIKKKNEESREGYYCNPYKEWVTPNGYCSHGERKGE